MSMLFQCGAIFINEHVHPSSSKSRACTAHKLTKAAILAREAASTGERL